MEKTVWKRSVEVMIKENGPENLKNVYFSLISCKHFNLQ